MYKILCLAGFVLLFSSVIAQVNPPVLLNTDTVTKWEPDTTRDIIVDDGLPGFWTQGNWFESRNEENYWGHSYLAHDKGTGGGKAFWNPIILTPGTYEIFINYSRHNNRAPNATYTIIYANGTTAKVINQKELPTPWVSLGTYQFNADTSGMVILTDNADGFVIADAAVFSPRDITKNIDTSKPALSPRKK